MAVIVWATCSSGSVLWSRGRRTEAGACGSLTSPQQHGGSRGTLAGAGRSEAAAVRAHAPAP